MNAPIEDLESTLDQPLLAPHDHTLLLKAVQVYTPKIIAALGSRAKLRPLPAEHVVRVIASLQGADDKTHHTAQQVLSFLGPLSHVPLPSSYEATLATVDKALAAARHPMAVVQALSDLRDAKAHDRVPGFQIGVNSALDLMGDALGTAGTMMTGVTVFGRRDPAGVAKACARGCVKGALEGTINRVGAGVSSVVGGVAGSTVAMIVAAMDLPAH